MATQLKHTDFSYPTAPAHRPNVRVVFSAGAATMATRAALADLSPAVREATLEEVALADQTRALIDEAAKLLSPAMYSAFLCWGEAASHFSSSYYDDDEGEVRLTRTAEALKRVAALPVANVHDYAFKAYLMALEMGDCSCFGPLSTDEVDGGCSLIALVNGIAADQAWISHLTAMIDELAQAAWDASPNKSSFAVHIGAAITSTFTAAIDRDRQQVQPVVTNTAPGVPAGYAPYMRGALIQWQRQYQRYEEARDAFLAYDRDVHTPTFANEDVPRDVADAVQMQYDNLLAAEHEEVERLYRLPAPSAAELAIKLKIFAEKDSCGLTYGLEAIGYITIDARRHGRLGAHLETDRALLEGFAARCHEFEASIGVEMSGAEEDAYWTRIDAAEKPLHDGSATTIEGVVAKLRLTFPHLTSEAYADHALGDPASAVFRKGLAMDGMYIRLLWSAIEDFARIGGVSLSEKAA